MISSYLIDIVFLLTAAVVVVPICQFLRLGAVPGFLIAGAIVGPAGLKLITKISEISIFSEIGVVLLLFVIAIELKTSRLWQMRRLVFGLGTLQLLITAIALGFLVNYILDIPMRAAYFIGAVLALSSSAFVLQILSEQKLINSHYGRTSIAVLLLQDFAVVPLLALVPLLVMPEISIGIEIGFTLLQTLLILSAVILVGRYLLHPVLTIVARCGNPEVFTASAVLIVLGTSIATEHAGLSMAMGAFLAGLLISNSSYRHQIKAEIQPLRGLLLGLFFMSMGMSFRLDLLLHEPLFTLLIVAALVIIKSLILFPLAYWFGAKRNDAIAISLVLAQGGEFALVLFSLAFQNALLSQELFQQLLLVVLLSMLVTPLLAKIAENLVRTPSKSKEVELNTVEDAPIVLAGFGRVGSRIGEILTTAGKPFVAFDLDANIVQQARKNGYPVFYGDVTKLDLLNSVGASRSRIMIVTLNNPDATEQVITSLRDTHKKVSIYARAHNSIQCRKLMQIGANGVVSENIEASLELASMILSDLDVDNNQKETIINDFRKVYYAQIEEPI